MAKNLERKTINAVDFIITNGPNFNSYCRFEDITFYDRINFFVSKVVYHSVMLMFY